MNQYEEKIKNYITNNKINAEHLVFEQSCHSVEEAAQAAKATPEDLVKNICLKDKEGNLIVAIVKGEDKVSDSKIAKLLNISKPKSCNQDEILIKTGFICGGVPSFGYDATFIVDERVMEKDWVLTGGGSENSLIKISPLEMINTNKAKVAEIRK